MEKTVKNMNSMLIVHGISSFGKALFIEITAIDFSHMRRLQNRYAPAFDLIHTLLSI
jgi:hypothetical protein